MTAPLVVWQLADGKRGHERQVEGLLAALATRTAVDHCRLAVPTSPWRRGAAWLGGELPGAAALPPPHFLVGAGRACQWPLLAARRHHGGRAIYLMRPQLPTRWFDLCVIPRHDGVAATDHVLVSEGPLNPMQARRGPRADLGLVLLGGPSRHHGWDEAALFRQIERLLARPSPARWVVSDSRRSPPGLATTLARNERLEFHSHRDTPPHWLPARLAEAAEVWVTADSAGMLYEALSAGATVGVLDVPARRRDRVSGIAPALVARGWVRRLDDLARGDLPSPAVVLDEAARVADWLLTHWPPREAT